METLIHFDVTNDQITQIGNWLKEEEEHSGDGFYCNFHLIENSFLQKQIAVITLDMKVVGFVTWLEGELTLRINIAEIRPSHRNKGLCKKLIHCLENRAFKQGIVALDLQCSPASSEVIWKKIGFKEFPKIPDGWEYHRGHKQLFKILVPTLAPSSEPSGEDTIEVWNQEPNRIRGDKRPTAIWNIPNLRSVSAFPKPIIIPGYSKWRIRYSKNNQTVYDGQLERFSKERLCEKDMIIIKQIPKEYV